mmetsp:Transcript_61371/g.161273  ORF Transcript_61371/g.161273 Transcript_61371/m.161273 type:complete len:793 (+) Transcript_61371:260-2638(+)
MADGRADGREKEKGPGRAARERARADSSYPADGHPHLAARGVLGLVEVEELLQLGARLPVGRLVLAEEHVEALGAQLGHPEDVVGAVLVELLRLNRVVRRDDVVRLGPDFPRHPEDLQVRGAAQHGVRDRREDDPRLGQVGVDEHLLHGDVVDKRALHALLPHRGHGIFVVVDHVHLLQELRSLERDLGEQHHGDPVEAEQDDVARVLRLQLLPLGPPLPHDDLGPRLAEELEQDAVPEPEDLVVVLDAVDGPDVEDREGKQKDDHRVRGDVPEALPHDAEHQGELADLRQVDRRQRREAHAAALEADDRADPDGPGHHREERQDDRLEKEAERGHRDLHTEAREEERDEEVSDVLDLRVELRAVREGCEGDAGRERGELHGDADERHDGDAADEEAPGQGHDEHQLHALLAVVHHGGRHELRVEQGDGEHEELDADVLDDVAGVRALGEVRLEGHDDDGPAVLAEEHADREASRGGVAFSALVIQDPLHDHRGGEGGAHRDVQRGVVAVSELEAERPQDKGEEVQEAEADRELHESGDNRLPRHGEDLVDVHLQADHEEEEDEAQRAQLLDVDVAVHDVQNARADDEPGQDIPEDDRLLEEVDDEAHEPGRGEGEGDVLHQRRGACAEAAVSGGARYLLVGYHPELEGGREQHEDEEAGGDEVDGDLHNHRLAQRAPGDDHRIHLAGHGVHDPVLRRRPQLGLGREGRDGPVLGRGRLLRLHGQGRPRAGLPDVSSGRCSCSVRLARLLLGDLELLGAHGVGVHEDVRVVVVWIQRTLIVIALRQVLLRRI